MKLYESMPADCLERVVKIYPASPNFFTKSGHQFSDQHLAWYSKRPPPLHLYAASSHGTSQDDAQSGDSDSPRAHRKVSQGKFPVQRVPRLDQRIDGAAQAIVEEDRSRRDLVISLTKQILQHPRRKELMNDVFPDRGVQHTSISNHVKQHINKQGNVEACHLSEKKYERFHRYVTSGHLNLVKGTGRGRRHANSPGQVEHFSAKKHLNPVPGDENVHQLINVFQEDQRYHERMQLNGWTTSPWKTTTTTTT